jgi:hypothetical protein
VAAAPHDISPPLEEQLVLELELRETCGEAVSLLPSGRGRRLSLPADKKVADTVRHARTHHALWLEDDRAMVDWRQGRWCVRRSPFERLEQADVEDIVEAGPWRKFKLVGTGLMIVTILYDPKNRGRSLLEVLTCREAGARWRRRSHTQSHTGKVRSRWCLL